MSHIAKQALELIQKHGDERSFALIAHDFIKADWHQKCQNKWMGVYIAQVS